MIVSLTANFYLWRIGQGGRQYDGLVVEMVKDDVSNSIPVLGSITVPRMSVPY